MFQPVWAQEDLFREYPKWLREFSVGEPIESCWRPLIGLETTGVTIRFRTRDALGNGESFTATFMHPFPLRGLPWSRLEFHNFLRGAFHALVIHEVDEAVRVNGMAVFNPHNGSYDHPEVIARYRRY